MSQLWSPGCKSRAASNDPGMQSNADLLDTHVAITCNTLSLAVPFIACEAWPFDATPKPKSDALAGQGSVNIKRLLFTFGVVAMFMTLLLFLWGDAPSNAGLSKKLDFKVHNRNVLLYAPAFQLRAKALPLVLVLHGSNDSVYKFANTTRYHAVMDSALVLYPEMRIPMGDTWEYNASWETAFFRALPDAVAKAGYSVNFSQIFIVGHSSGGSMALFLQNNMPDLFQAAAAVEAGVGHLEDWYNQSSDRPVMLIWNHNDPVLQEFGGESLYYSSVRQLRRHDPAGPSAEASWVDPVVLPQASFSGIEYAEWMTWPAAGNASVLEVVSWRSFNPTHSWASPRVVSGAFDAAVVTWHFFRSTAHVASK